METNIIYNEDCIIGMSKLPDKSIDMILCDLPYGVTDCIWDKLLPLNLLWEQYERIIKDRGAIVLTSIQPFTTRLVHSNIKRFRYCWYWIKNNSTGFCFSKYQPMRNVEDICVFYKQSPLYNPQGLIRLDEPITKHKNDSGKETIYKKSSLTGKSYQSAYTNYPKQTLMFNKDFGLHPTQKPVALFEYLIRTYTKEDDIVLDNCIGSGTTAVAALNTGRRYIGFELDERYYDVACVRVKTIHSYRLK